LGVAVVDFVELFAIHKLQSKLMRLAQHLLLILITFLSLSCLVASQVGAIGFFKQFSQPFTAEDYLTMVLEQSLGPVIILVMAGLMAHKLYRRSKLPRWVLLVGLGAIYFSIYMVGHVSHDFSHVIFEECSGKYGTVITWADGLLGLALLLIFMLEAPLHSVARPPRFPRQWHVVGLTGCFGLLLLLEMASTKYPALDEILNPQIPFLVRLSGGYSGFIFSVQFFVLPVCYGLCLYGLFHLVRFWAVAQAGVKP
jgi:hypothetical protein